jgi:hypothetical protein
LKSLFFGKKAMGKGERTAVFFRKRRRRRSVGIDHVRHVVGEDHEGFPPLHPELAAVLAGV